MWVLRNTAHGGLALYQHLSRGVGERLEATPTQEIIHTVQKIKRFRNLRHKLSSSRQRGTGRQIGKLWTRDEKSLT